MDSHEAKQEAPSKSSEGMDCKEIIAEIKTRITYKHLDEKSMCAQTRYMEAMKLKTEREELENLLSVILS